MSVYNAMNMLGRQTRVESAEKDLGLILPNLNVEAVKNLAISMVDDENSAVNLELQKKALLQIAENKMMEKNKKIVKINVEADETVRQKIAKIYPEYSVNYISRGGSRSHVLAYISRMVDTEILYYSFPMSDINGKNGIMITDVGGNYQNTAFRKQYGVHCCCPILETRDAKRNVERELSIAVACRNGKLRDNFAYVDTFKGIRTVKDVDFDSANTLRCFSKAQDCKVQTKYGVCVHSTYDITLEQLAEIMHNKGMEMLKGCMLISNGMLDEMQGQLEDIDGFYKILVENGKKKIYFSFIGDPSAGYYHDYSEFIRYLFSTVVTYNGVQYSYSVMKQRGSTLYFSMVKLECKALKALPNYRPIIKHMRRLVKVCTYKVKKPMVYKYTDVRAYEPVEVYVPREAWDHMLTKVLANERWDRMKIHDYVRSANVRFVVNGLPMTLDENIAFEDIEAIVTALVVAAFRMRYEMGQQLSVTTAAIKDQRALFEGISTLNVVMKKFYESLLKSVFDLEKDFVDKVFPMWKKRLDADCRFLNVFEWFPIVYCYVEGGMNVVDVNVHDGEPWHLDECYNGSEDISDGYVFDSVEELRAMLEVYAPEKLHLLPDVEGVFEDTETVVTEESTETVITTNNVKDILTPNTPMKTVMEFQPYFTKGGYDENLVQDLVMCSQPTFDGGGLDSLETAAMSEIQKVSESILVIDEGRRYHAVGALTAISEAVQIRNSAVVGANSEKEFLATKQDEKVKPNIVYTDHGGTKIVRSLFNTELDYMAGIDDDGKLVRIYKKRVNGRFEIHAERIVKRLFVTEALRIYTGEDISQSLLKLQSNSLCDGFKFVFPEIVLWDGVSGSGKTSHIERAWKKGDLIIVAGADPARRLRKKMVEAGVMTEKEADKYIRTFDSYVMRPDVQASIVYFDEVFMVHSSSVYAVLMLCGAKEAHAFGDSFQIPFVNFFSSLINISYPSFKRYSRIEYTNVTNRYGTLTAMIASYLYGFKVHTTSKRRDEVELLKISSIADVPFDDQSALITYLQNDKKELKSRGAKKVNTIHESEGNTNYEKVTCLVRLDWRPNDIYSKDAYNIVGATRHANLFKYLTVDDNDSLSKAIKWAKARSHLQESFYVDLADKERIKVLNETSRDVLAESLMEV